MAKILPLVTQRALREGDTGPSVKALQSRLRSFGHELVIDGAFGPATKIAVVAFQGRNRIAADGYVGPITAAYLDVESPDAGEKPLPSVLAVAPWLTWMRAMTGTKEFPGDRNNPVILAWRTALSAKYPRLRRNIDWYTKDSIAWCGLGEAAAVGLCIPGWHPPDAPLWALNWKVGAWKYDLDEPCLGCIMVKPRTGGGHVTTYEGEDGSRYFCRGANQSNMINVASYSKKDKWTFHWPVGGPEPKRGRVRTSFADAVHNAGMA
jgi:uncharacterized protein (TIGR02594 family)